MQKLGGSTTQIPVTEKTCYSVAGLGNKWIWVIYNDHLGDGSNPTAFGFESSKQQAMGKIAHLHGQGRRVSAQFARLAYKKFQAQKRMQKVATTTNPIRIEYLYAVDRIGGGLTRVSLYRIIKRTANRVYILKYRDSYTTYDRAGRLQEEVQEATGDLGIVPGEEWRHFAESLRSVDRISLLKKGRTSTWDGLSFYVDLRQVFNWGLSDTPTDRPWWVEALNLGDILSAKRVRDAYRRLSKVLHPDAGGTPEAFVHLNKAYKEALQIVGS